MYNILKYLFYYFKSIFKPAVCVSDADAAEVFFDLLATNGCGDDGNQICKDNLQEN